MAYDISSLEDYVKQNNFPLIKKSIAGSRIAQILSPSLQVGVKSSVTLNLAEVDLVFQDDSCSRDPQGSFVISQRPLTVAPIAVHQDFCPKELEKKFTQYQVKAGSNQDEMTFEEEFTESLAKKISLNLGKMIAQGDTTSLDVNLNKFDGLIKLAVDSGQAIDGNPNSLTFDETNAVEAMDDFYKAIPTDILDSEDLVVIMGMDYFRTWTVALKNANLFHYSGMASNFELIIPGTNVKVIGDNSFNGSDTILAGRISNLFPGTDLEGEEDNFELWYSKDDRVVKFSVAFKYGVQIAFPDQVVLGSY
jgi:hypothetical protein